jgi:hypothetical protein
MAFAADEGGLSAGSRRREWTPKIWAGCNFYAWARLLATNRFAVHWSCWHRACVITAVSVFNSMLGSVQELLYGRRVRNTPIRDAPLFIIGHPRTGTTFLHELLALDERHTCPTTYEVLAPNHFLLTERLFTRWLEFLLPENRPSDNVPLQWDRPQEDEFALCMMGQPSPYLSIAFPNRSPQCLEYLDLESLSPEALESWKSSFLGFLRSLTFKNPKRLVLKSPPHSRRIKVLLQMFPEARFIHIVRNPYMVFPSSVNMLKELCRAHSLQRPHFRGLEEYVFQNFNRLYERLEEGLKLVRPNRFYELRYEELVRDPISQLRALYRHLELDGFDRLVPRLQEYLASIAGFETNRHQLSPDLRAEISRRWGRVIDKYGYAEK